MKVRGVVLDTNVVIAALRSKRGASNRLLELTAGGELQLHISVPLVLEYETVLRRQSRILGLSHTEVSEFIDFICRVGRKHDMHFMWRPILKDPNDDMVLEIAIASGMDLVTFNTRDFHGAERFGVRVWEPGNYLGKWKGSS